MNDLDDWLISIKPDTATEVDETSKKSYKLDLFKTVLPAIDRRDKYFYRSLTKDQQDEITPWILMRILTWGQNNSQPDNLLLINDIVNSNFNRFSPSKTMNREGHKELQWMLLSMCGSGNSRTSRNKLSAPKGIVRNKLETELTKLFPRLKYKDLELLININSTDEIKQFFIENGYDNKTIDSIFG